ncbi:DUF962 domain-containing protein [Brevibacillus humidisoli]|uniref:DUF962 domain-containing protein n=1 Tax=Brevibacillus humidisoli TaxID=2895522 RepID=UPI001E4765B4|nr:DUF962 domain-containing protein [Brevibacillus humidisoli]UFJ40807.1 DUF962 domain-containing protein [Brevibacillus humidisoli]
MKQRVTRDLLAYQQAHRNRYNQQLHYLAFLAAFIGWVALWFDWRVTVGCAVLHYVFSWVGHFFFEGNRPASFKHPFLGFYAGFLWFFLRSLELISKKQLLPLPAVPQANEGTDDGSAA